MMDTRNVFRRLSEKMLADFSLSAEITHDGGKGTYRESTLKKFLSTGRLPTRYGIGSGEIVGPARNVSKQSDLIIYDQLDGISLIYDENTQVYPIECVAGTIEVKSTLNKTEFLKSLDNIRSVKELVPQEKTTRQSMSGSLTMTYQRPRPFGAVFGYRLGNNSLSSLEENLREWESSVPREHWPNIVAVLDEGVIQHYGAGLRVVHTNRDLRKASHISSIHYREDTLFQFYSTIIDLCASTDLGPVVLSRYYRQPEQMGNYLVANHDGFTRDDCDDVFKFSEGFVSKIVDYCRKQGALTNRQLFMLRFGNIPIGIDKKILDQEAFLYNPDGLKGIHEVNDPIRMQGGFAVAVEGIMEPCHYIVVNGDSYYIPPAYISQEDMEAIPGRKKSDL